MGNNLSRSSSPVGIISYQDAIKRCSLEEIERYKSGWQIIHTKNVRGKQHLDKSTFIRSVLGKNVPPHIASQLFTTVDKSKHGFLSYQDFICAIVLLSKGTQEEKLKLVYGIYQRPQEGKITKDEMTSILKEDLCEPLQGSLLDEKLKQWFSKYDIRGTGSLDSSAIVKWANDNKSQTALLEWAYSDRSFSPDMCNNSEEHQKSNQDNNQRTYIKSLKPEFRTANIRSVKEISTFTNLNDKEVKKLEEVYCEVIQQAGRVDKLSFASLFPFQLPPRLLDSLFRFFDERLNGYLDSREFVVGFSYLARPSSDTEVSQFWFYLLDEAQEYFLSREEFSLGVELLVSFQALNYERNENIDIIEETETYVKDAYKEFQVEEAGQVSFDQFHAWFHHIDIGIYFIQEMNRMAQLVLGLRPSEAQEERETIKSLTKLHSTMVLGDTYYLLSIVWWNKWKTYVGYDTEPSSKRTKIGTIQNQKISLPGQSLILKPNLKPNRDFILLPEPVWSALWKWYGGGPSFPRKVIQNQLDNTLDVEIYPYTLILMLRRTTLTTLPSKRIEMMASKSPNYSLKNLKTDGAQQLNISDLSRIRIWNAKNENHPILLENLSQSVQDAGIVNNQKIIFELKTDDDIWPITERQEANAATNTALPGLVGLQNLGNTCFINSAVQCLSNTFPLTEYFLNNYHLRELNRVNPIGMQGNVARAFGKIIRKMWLPSTHGRVPAVLNPRKFRRTIGRYDISLADGQQHDAQEFLTFLMNGLHEDLNRVLDKKYEENPDGEMDDEDKAKLFWEAYLRRNQSIIVDLFQGQFRSSLTCQTCSHSSVTFEPFTFLQLPLPMEKTRVFHVILHFLDPEQVPIKYSLTVPSIGSVSVIRMELAKLCEIPGKEILLIEVNKQSFRRYLRNSISVNSIAHDILHGFQVPSRYKKKKRKKEKKEKKEKEFFAPTLVHISIVLRYLQVQSVYFLTPWRPVLFGSPFAITITGKITLEQLQQQIITAIGSALKIEQPNNKIPFDIHITSKSGDSCGICRWDRFCSGCRLEEDNIASLSTETTLALTFDQNTLTQYDATQADKFEEHKSVKEAQEKQESPITLDECFKLFTEAEMMDDNESWYCPKCKEFRAAIKKLDIWKLPKVLVIQLKRFHFRGRFMKISRLVDFPRSGLDMSDFVLSQNDPAEPYNLFSVLNHFGGLRGGHYTTYAMNHNDRNWYGFNDRRVNECDQDKVVTAAAYVLFFAAESISQFQLSEPENKVEFHESRNCRFM